MTKLPEPACTVSPYEVNHIFWEAGHEQAGCGSSLFTEAQMLQFRRDALEEAALVCDTTDIVTYTFAGQLYDSGAETLGRAIDDIRALTKEIK